MNRGRRGGLLGPNWNGVGEIVVEGNLRRRQCALMYDFVLGDNSNSGKEEYPQSSLFFASSLSVKIRHRNRPRICHHLRLRP